MGNSTLQLATDPGMRGRVMALWSVAFLGSTPIGGPLIGWITATAGARVGLGVGAFSCFVAGAIGVVAMRRSRVRGLVHALTRQDGRVVPTTGRDDAAQIEGVEVADAGYCVLMTTIGSDDEARVLCRSLVEAGLVACAQRVPIESLYRWEGELVEDRETLVLLKTRRARSPEVMAVLRGAASL